MNNFNTFAQAIRERFDHIAQSPLFVVDIDPDALWVAYLAAFPAGADPIYKTNTEHDCNCCKGFIRHVGAVVSIDPVTMQMQTLWDVPAQSPYKEVAGVLHALVLNAPVDRLFTSVERRFGKRSNIAQLEDGQTIEFNHFHCEVPQRHRSAGGARRSLAASSVQVIDRACREITPEAVASVQELVADGALYRGTEDVAKRLDAFAAFQRKYLDAGEAMRNRMVWLNHANSDLLLRNTAVGQLLQDITAGTGLEAAVRKYEAMVAPANYKRSSAIITKAMVGKALEELRGLGLEEAVARRYATMADVGIDDMLWVNRSSEDASGTLEGMLAEETRSRKPVVTGKGAKTVSADEFFGEVLPTARKLEVLFDRIHAGNMVSLTTGAPGLFAWDRPLAWAYSGDVTDSVKERVKQAGGSVDGWGRVSLSWFNTDDLDLHVEQPDCSLIYHGAKHPVSRCGGRLDVDMNVSGPVCDAVENVTWPQRMLDGSYRVRVHNYTRRNSTNVGFQVDVDVGGVEARMSYSRNIPNKQYVDVCTLRLKDGGCTVDLAEGISAVAHQQEIWGLLTGDFVEASMVVPSPNASGLRHWFFVLEGCRSPDAARGFFNEFLHPKLKDHRKVFEVLGGKMKCAYADDQLSGLGFSSTTRNTLTVRIDGARQYIVKF